MSFSVEAIASYIDHTILKADATSEDILRLCSEAAEHRFKAVCVNPSRVPLAVKTLSGTGVQVCTVVGFPLGASTSAAKAFEAAEAARNGAAEIDMVINIGLLKEGKEDDVYRDIKAVVDAVSPVSSEAIVKVIIETCYLTSEEKIKASLISERAGASFVKTSTGMGTAGADVEDIKLIRGTVSPNIGIKASGGIKTLEQALKMIEAGATRLGTSSGVQIIKELLNHN
ncbi:MAG: deoxyribose-phosphate aldolase [Bacillota bacterium]